MANICDTRLKITKEDDKTFLIIECDEIKTYIEQNYAYDREVYSYDHDFDWIEISCGTKWNVMTEELIKMAKRFNVNIRAIGEEPGVGFIQVVKIDPKGEIIQDDEIEI